MITLASPIGTGPTRWAMATAWISWARLQALGDARHLGLGHLGVGVVFELGHGAPAGVVAGGADEGRDRPGVGRDTSATRAFRSSGSDCTRKPPPETGGITATSSPAGRGCVALDVLAVAGIGDSRRLLAELQGRPDVGGNRAVGEVECTL